MMDARTRILLGLVLVGAAGVWAWAAFAGDAPARLLEESSGVTGRIRDLDRAARGCSSDGERAAAARVLTQLKQDAFGQATLQGALSEAQACLGTADCARCLPPPLQRAEEAYAAVLRDAFKASRDAQDQHQSLLRLGLLLWLAAAALTLAWPRKRQAASPVELAKVEDQGALEDLLRRRLEELYDVRLKAVQADRFAYFGEVASGLSHGLKTPLAGIRAAASVAQAKLDEKHPAQANLADVVTEVDALVDQINAFLAGTRLGAPALAPVAVTTLLQGPVHDAETRATASSVRVLFEDGAGDARVQVDAGLMQLALANLVDNAVSVTPSGGLVTVRTRRAPAPARVGLEDVPPETGSSWVELSVLDDGPGLPSAVTAGVVVPSTRVGGSGLGVAVTRRIVARHGGALVLARRDGRGTCASVLLPVMKEGAA